MVPHAKFAGTRLPTLEAWPLDAIQPGAATLIERKAGDAATCVALLERKGLVDQVVVQAFDWQFLKDCRDCRPSWRWSRLGGEELSDERLDEIAGFGAVGIGWHDEDVSEATVLSAHDRGLKLWVWTVDDPARGHKLVSWRRDGIITNVPAAMRTALKAQDSE